MNPTLLVALLIVVSVILVAFTIQLHSATDELRRTILALPKPHVPGDRVVTRDRVVLPIDSGENVLPLKVATWIAGFPKNSFDPERIIIGGNAGDWIINDVQIDGVSQFAHGGDVPGEMFASTTIDSFVKFQTVPTGGKLDVAVTYVGTCPTGAPFVCSVLGEASAPGETTFAS